MKRLIAIFVLFGILALPSPALASHSWGDYHWARSLNPFTLNLGRNLTSSWTPYLSTTSTDWSASAILDTQIVTGGTTAKRCKPNPGRIEVCNSSYGNNGWLGIAQIWISGNHITQGITKVNDTYFNKAQYNKPAWRNLVLCQEVGHTFGLDHQDEIFDNPNLGTCMDYTNSPDSNQHPNTHDYEQLEQIYGHFDTFSTLQAGSQSLPLGQLISESVRNGDFENRKDWGKELKNNGQIAKYERDFGVGQKLITFVIWAQE